MKKIVSIILVLVLGLNVSVANATTPPNNEGIVSITPEEFQYKIKESTSLNLGTDGSNDDGGTIYKVGGGQDFKHVTVSGFYNTEGEFEAEVSNSLGLSFGLGYKKNSESGELELALTGALESNYDTPERYYSDLPPNIRDIVKPVIDSMFADVERNYRAYYAMLVARLMPLGSVSSEFTRMGFTSTQAGAMAGYMSSQSVETYTKATMDHWRYYVMGSMFDYANGVKESVESGIPTAIDNSDSFYTLALSTAGYGFGNANKLLIEIGEKIAESKQRLYLSSINFEIGKQSRLEERAKYLAERENITTDYLRALRMLDNAKKYGSNYVELSLKEINQVTNEELKAELIADWDFHFKDNSVLLELKEDPQYKKAIVDIRLAKRYGDTYISKAKVSIQLVKNELLRNELMHEWNEAFLSGEKARLAEEELEIARTSFNYLIAYNSLKNAKKHGGSYIEQAREQIINVENEILREELQVDYNEHFN